MPINILMPALSPTMEKGNLAKWLKKEGDAIKTGDVIAEIETDKATMEYEAVEDGVMAKIVVPEGTSDVPVNQLIAVLAQEGEDVKAAAAAVGKGAPPPKPPATAPAPSTATAAAPQARAPAPPPPVASAPRLASTAEPVRANGHGNRIFSSPLARRLAKEAGIALDRIQGSGPHGRVIARDVEAAKSGLSRGTFDGGQDQRSETATREIRMNEDGPHLGGVGRWIQQFGLASGTAVRSEQRLPLRPPAASGGSHSQVLVESLGDEVGLV